MDKKKDVPLNMPLRMQSNSSERNHKGPYKQSVLQKSPAKEKQSFLSFEAMITSWLLPRAKTKRNADIFMNRMGWSGDGSKTLEDIGDVYGLTRERVRQIESKLMLKITKKWVVTELTILWSAINHIVESFGILDLNDLGQQLINYFKWESCSSPDGLEKIVSLHPDPTFIFTKEESKGYLILINLKCIGCKQISEYLLTRISGGQISLTSVISAFDFFCKKNCNQQHLLIGSTFIRYMIVNNEHLSTYLKAEEDIIYTTDYWNLFHGRLLSAAEAILKISGRAMHFTEIADKLREAKRNDFLPRNIHAALDRSNAAILWGRGTFIHSQHMTYSDELIKKIEKWIDEKLKQHIPLVSVFGAFKAFHLECVNAGIPNEVALYSCLRLSADQRFVYPDYPNIYLSTSKKVFSSFSAIEKYIINAGGPISLVKLREYAIADLGLKEFQLTNALDKNADILRFKKGEYVHRDYLNIEEDKLDEITNYIKHILSTQAHVSVEKIFRDKIIDCKLMGIEEPVLLFSLLQQYADDRAPQAHKEVLNVKEPIVHKLHKRWRKALQSRPAGAGFKQP